MEAKDGSGVNLQEEQSTSQNRIILRSDDDTVVLRQLIPEDAIHYFNLVDASREHLSQNGENTSRKYPTLESVMDSMENQPTGRVRFGIWDGDIMVGSDNLTPVDDRVAELGSWIGKEHTGHNYASRARKLIVDYAFNQLNLEEVFCLIAASNIPSRKSVEHSGFQLTTQSEDKMVYTLHNPNK